MLFPGSMELVRLVVKLEVPVAGLRVVVLLIGNGVVTVVLAVVVELIVVVMFVLVEEIEMPLDPPPEVGKL